MSQGMFITAPGTEIGKTFVTCALLHQIYRANVAVEAIKPLASGVLAGDPESDPARILRAMGRPHHQTAIDGICPWRYEDAVAVNIAAARGGKRLEWTDVVAFCKRKIAQPGLTLVEGAGGIMSPITNTKLVIDLMVELDAPSIMVTGNYLGAISHTLSALQVLSHAQLPMLGMVVCESEEPAVDQVEYTRMLRNYLPENVPLIWAPRTSDKADAYKFAPTMDALWRDYVALG